mmetsp:Transcript_104164/g.334149  ORF Transcript_104164/g.334149 Transcript_104164/m.334149 type:complete len:325 (-) Transcript_104164:48-1022(-)
MTSREPADGSAPRGRSRSPEARRAAGGSTTGEEAGAQQVPRLMFLLAGQSNMAGRGPLTEPCATLGGADDPRVAVLGPDGRWQVPARHPLHNDKPDKVGVGPGLAFARAVVDFLPADSQHVGLLPCAVGGSPLERWMSPNGDLLAVARSQLAAGRAAGGHLAGILWHQGESDCSCEADSSSYASRLRRALQGLREASGEPDVPVVLGELGVHFLDQVGDPRFRHAARVNCAIAEVAAGDARAELASAHGLAHKGDRLHFSSTAADELGRRYAWQWLRLSGRAHGSLRLLLGSSLEPPLLSESGRDQASDGCRGENVPTGTVVLD